MFFTSFFHVICKISKHLAQASCTKWILRKKILIRKIFHPTILFQTSYSQGRTIRLSRLNAWKGHLANFSHKYWSKTFMQHFICQKSRQLHPSDFNALFVSKYSYFTFIEKQEILVKVSFLSKLDKYELQLSKAMKSSPLLGPFCGSELWGFSLLGVVCFYVSNLRQQSATEKSTVNQCRADYCLKFET